jgi:hypothetical protein
LTPDEILRDSMTTHIGQDAESLPLGRTVVEIVEIGDDPFPMP